MLSITHSKRVLKPGRVHRLLWGLLWSLLWLVSACTSVRDMGWDPQGYTVKKGDTLYSIAWRYEMDYRDVARWNQIGAPFAIYPGQRLRMAADSQAGTMDREQKQSLIMPSGEDHVQADAGSPSNAQDDVQAIPGLRLPQQSTQRVTKGDTIYSIARRHGLTTHQLARWNALKKPYAIYPGQQLRLRPPQAALGSHRPVISRPVVVAPIASSRQPGKSASQTRASSMASGLPAKVDRWLWPAKGKVVKTFSSRDTARKGIGIVGNRGQAIKAAAGGQVVYSGNGLISYGNLVIIKHSNAFLSAYAHNRKLLVKEGERVKAGQTIAHMGTEEGGRAQLHFEIRKNGKPVNPLSYLPRNRS